MVKDGGKSFGASFLLCFYIVSTSFLPGFFQVSSRFSLARSQWSVLQAMQASLKPQDVALKSLQPSSAGAHPGSWWYVSHMIVIGMSWCIQGSSKDFFEISLIIIAQCIDFSC